MKEKYTGALISTAVTSPLPRHGKARQGTATESTVQDEAKHIGKRQTDAKQSKGKQKHGRVGEGKAGEGVGSLVSPRWAAKVVRAAVSSRCFTRNWEFFHLSE